MQCLGLRGWEIWVDGDSFGKQCLTECLQNGSVGLGKALGPVGKSAGKLQVWRAVPRGCEGEDSLAQSRHGAIPGAGISALSAVLGWG